MLPKKQVHDWRSFAFYYVLIIFFGVTWLTLCQHSLFGTIIRFSQYQWGDPAELGQIPLRSITVMSQWARRCVKSPASPLFTQPFIQTQIKKTSKLRVTGLCEGNSPVTGEFLAQVVSNAENFPIWWRRHAMAQTKRKQNTTWWDVLFLYTGGSKDRATYMLPHYIHIDGLVQDYAVSPLLTHWRYCTALL